MRLVKDSGLTFKGHWFKGNLHSHTTYSDGKWTPEEAVQAYREKGYHFLAVTDHDQFRDHRNTLNSKQFITLPGVEVSALLVDSSTMRVAKVHHMNAILGTSEMQAQASLPLFTHGQKIPPVVFADRWEGLNVAQKILDGLRSRGMIVTYNHPAWSRVESEEFVDLDGIWAYEVFNHGTELESNTGYDEIHWEMMLRKGKRLHAFASDDNHNHPDLDDAFGGYIVLSAPELSHDAVINELIAGNYYSSSGAAINSWSVVSGKAIVECSRAHHITFYCGNHLNDGRTFFAHDTEKGLSYAEYELKGHESYIRVVCTDFMGKKAWSNPIYLKEN